jgi:hypothetical protein
MTSKRARQPSKDPGPGRFRTVGGRVLMKHFTGGVLSVREIDRAWEKVWSHGIVCHTHISEFGAHADDITCEWRMRARNFQCGRRATLFATGSRAPAKHDAGKRRFSS